MAQAFSSQSLNLKAPVRNLASPREMCGGQTGTEEVFLLVHWFSSVIIIPPRLSILLYYLGDEQ
jgi:hypothetical protein